MAQFRVARSNNEGPMPNKLKRQRVEKDNESRIDAAFQINERVRGWTNTPTQTIYVLDNISYHRNAAVTQFLRE